MKKEKLYLSTTADDAAALARQYGLGLELAEYCTAWNMDDEFEETHAQVTEEMKGIDRFTFHAPFNELYPSAIDRKAAALARERYLQAAELSVKTYGIRRIIVHSGYLPLVYFPSWFIERSVIFWKDLLQELPEDVTVCYENVMEEDPEAMLEVIRQVNDPRFVMCLDVGHAHAVSEKMTVYDWLERCAPCIGHFHIHNNNGSRDLHAPLGEGSMDMERLLRRAAELCPEATYTIENMHAEESVRFLLEKGLLRK